jgi:O-antigen biosynthesis protein
VEPHLTSAGNGIRRGGDFDRWDLEIRDGPLGSARLLLSVEELGGGAQLVRYRCWPVVRRVTVGTVIALAAVGAAAEVGGVAVIAWTAGILAAALAVLSVVECGAALGALLAAVAAGVDATGSAAPAASSARRKLLTRMSRKRNDAAPVA